MRFLRFQSPPSEWHWNGADLTLKQSVLLGEFHCRLAQSGDLSRNKGIVSRELFIWLNSYWSVVAC